MRPLTPPAAFWASMRAAKPLGMVTEFDESGPDSEVTRATLMESALTPGALAVLPAGGPLAVLPAGAVPAVLPLLPPVVVLDDEFFDELPHPATNRTIASAEPTRV